MWEKLDLEQFLEKYGQNLNSQKTIEKNKNHSENSRFLPKKKLVNPELNLTLKKCSYCQNKIPVKDFGNHIIKTCEKLPNSINFIINDSKTSKKKAKIKRILQSDDSNKEIQISEIVKNLNKPLPLIISLLRKVGLNVSTEQDYVSKLFADSLWLVFNPVTKKTPSFEIESKEISKTNVVNHEETNIKESKGIKISKSNSEKYNKPDLVQYEKHYKICPYCKSTVKTFKYDLHIKQKCPKRENQQPSTNPNNIQEGTSVLNKDLRKPSFVKENLPDTPQNKLEIEKIHWKLLPQGEWLFTELQNHFSRLSSTKKWRNKPFDEARLLKIEKNLKPNKCFVGKDEFDGYVVYCFNWTQNVILECPIYGNAIYIIKRGNSSWQEIAKATKWEARTKYSHQVKIINHNKTWLERLEQNLRFGL